MRFWGTRGSIPAPGPETLHYGGNTPCVQVLTDAGTLLVFDCGTGARKLGLALAKSGSVRAHLFIGHTHADHIQGLPFFVPAFLAGSNLTIYGPAGIDRSLPKALGGQMEYAYFPVPLDELAAQLDFVELGEGEMPVEEVRVRVQYLNHTSPCLGYRIEVGDTALVYATDHEPHAAPLWRPDRQPGSYELGAMLHPGDARHTEFLYGADLIIHDAQYTTEEYASKLGWGHSTIDYAVDVALAARAKRLALFHHDPNRTDDELDELVANRVSYAAANDRDLEVMAAAEGAEITLDERTATVITEQRADSAVARAPNRARVLVADNEADIVEVLDRALQQDGYEVVSVGSGAEALRLVLEQPFDLVVLDARLPDLDGFTISRTLRGEERLKDLPIVMLSAKNERNDLIEGFEAGVSDYMTKPFAVAQLRARVRAWLTRTR